MATLNRIRLHIAGSDYTLTTDEPEEYVRDLGRQVDERITAVLRSDDRVSSMMAAVLACLDLADECQKANDSADNLRGQIQGYLEDNGNVRQELDAARRELDRLHRENDFLRAKCGMNNGSNGR